MTTISPTIVLMVLVSALAQIAGLSLMPATRGFTAPVVSVAAVAFFATGIWIMARLTHAGVNLGVLIPIMAVLIPMGTVLVGVFYYGETSSLLKVGMLFVAFILIGAANLV